MPLLTKCRTCRNSIRRGDLLCSQCLTPQPHTLHEPVSRLQLAVLLTMLLVAAWFTWTVFSSLGSRS